MQESVKPLWESKRVNMDELRLCGYRITHILNTGDISESEDDIRPADSYDTDEIVEYEGKQYRLFRTAESTERLGDFNTLYNFLDDQRTGYFTVPDFISDKYPQSVPAVFIELPVILPEKLVSDYRSAVEIIVSMANK